MAITSVGYDGTVDEKQFREIMGYSASSEYGVGEAGAFNASSVAGQVLQVRLTAGTAWTAGVVDKMDAAETVQLEATTGTRWDMIALRRDYQPPGGSTSLKVLRGGKSMVLPSRASNPGVLDDQPLWLVKVESRSGQSVIAQYVDLRVWARNGGCTANHDLVRSYMQNTGTSIEINGVLWLRRVGANGQWEWVKPIELALSGGVDRIRVTGTGEASATSKDHPFQIGSDNGWNLAFDNNEIIARNNGKESQLVLRGDVSIAEQGTGSSSATRKDYVDEMVDNLLDVMPKTISGNVTITPKADTPTSVDVRFPVGSGWFSRTPNVVATAQTILIGDRVLGVSVDQVTQTGFRLWIHRTNATPTKVYWIAT